MELGIFRWQESVFLNPIINPINSFHLTKIGEENNAIK